jgi:hypothetical protein
MLELLKLQLQQGIEVVKGFIQEDVKEYLQRIIEEQKKKKVQEQSR